MLLEYIEREILDGEPWSAYSLNYLDLGGEIRDSWEKKNSDREQTTKRKLWRPKLTFWYFIPWLKFEPADSI
jgi:hypothetical protein